MNCLEQEMIHTAILTKRKSNQPGKRLVMALLLLWMLPLSAHAAALQEQEPLRQIIDQYLREQLSQQGQEVEIQVGRLDSRLRLSACAEQPVAFLPSGARLRGTLTVGVRCASPKPWTLYIPTEIRIYDQVVSATMPLTRGNVIAESDVTLIRQETTALHSGYFTKPEQVIGQIVKQNIQIGEPISPRRVKVPLMVKQGEEVTIIAAVGNLEVRSKGKALRNAAKGEVLSVRNTRSKRVIEAIAIRPGIVRINM
jgi:flagella basal body P-ring formation protein FlgA